MPQAHKKHSDQLRDSISKGALLYITSGAGVSFIILCFSS